MNPRIAATVRRVERAAGLVALAWLVSTALFGAGAIVDAFGAFTDAQALARAGALVLLVAWASMIALAVTAQQARAALGQPWTSHAIFVVVGAVLFPFIVPTVVLLAFEKRLLLVRGEPRPAYAITGLLLPALLSVLPVFVLAVSIATTSSGSTAIIAVVWALFFVSRVAFALHVRHICRDLAMTAAVDGSRAAFAAFATDPIGA